MTSDRTQRRKPSRRRNPPLRGWRRWALPLAAVFLGMMPFVIIECGLRSFDVAKPSSYDDPFVGFSRVHPLFELDRSAGEYRTAQSRLSFFGLQRFATQKSTGDFRVFCLGGSTVLGHPYQPDTAFSKWLELELSGAEPSRAFEIVNCGGSSYASYRLIPILQEVLEYEPDLIILMTGHNEFLEDRTYGSLKQRSRARAWIEDQLYSLHLVTLARRGIDTLRGPSPRSSPHRGQKTILESEVNARLNYGSGYASYERDEAWWQGVMEHFRHSLHLAVKMCSEAEVPLVLVNPGANLRDCPPFKSEHRSDLTPEQLAEWTAAFEEASRVDSEDPARALAIYARARTLDGEYAQLIYRVARCLDRLGRYEEAHKAYVQAKDLDVCPLRILEPMRDILFEVAQQTHTPLVDARGLLEKRSPQGIAGFNRYVDHVHPSIRGHQLIARSLAEKIGALSLLGDSAEWDRRQRRKAYQHHLQALGDLYLAQGRARIEFLEHWARRDRFRRDTAALDARGHLDLARSHFEFGERSEAQAAYRRALELDPASVSRLLDHALELFQEGCPQSAEVVLQLARENSSTVQVSTLAELALAILKLEQGQLDAALALYKKVRLPPSKGNNGISPWLIEVPDAFKRFTSMK